eukprot:TRINITY_DN9533_c0_g1_i1.p1 TRINITY_DN9533_c0_g1~~TRINITY_DN9533_c0_g1_i1.p1  ORF type:complete len:399 (-),score=110.10 TRINITY_DN9533_c0_g1_i1:97-1260(-)
MAFIPENSTVSDGAFMINDGEKEILAYLGGAKDVFPHIDQLPREVTTAPFEGDNDSFLKANGDDPILQAQMKNKVRKCAACGKPCAFTLKACNSCGASLVEVPITFTNNVFTGFIYGVQKGPFPFTVSFRHQDEETLVFDDLLALCPLHLNIIPATQYLPDWRYLLKDPVKGLKLINTLFDKGFDVMKSQFLSQSEWMKKTVAGDHSVDELKKFVAAGFNYPPSQYQLHTQQMLPPFTPNQYYLYLKNLHFTHGRFFPFEYVQAVLALNEKMEVNDETPVEDIIAHFEKKGISYDKIHSTAYERCNTSHRSLSNYALDDFEYVITAEAAYTIGEEGKLTKVEEADLNQIPKTDKVTLQNYGRPYTEAGRPQGSFYKHAKTFPSLNVW